MPEPTTILDSAFQRVSVDLHKPIVADAQIRQRVEYVCNNLSNRAGVRLLLSCLLASLHEPTVDIRKPFTQIGDADAFSGRAYDEQYVGPFVIEHELPCNSTTAFLSPALRNRNATLTRGLDLVGRPPQLYEAVIDLLDDVHKNRVASEDLLAETIRLLIILRNRRQQRIESLVEALKTTEGAASLSSEDMVNLVEQHMSLKGTSRLPVLLVAAAYNAAQRHLGERILSLQPHNAADIQTGALGDVEVVLLSDNRLVTSYEMKDRRVVREDIDRALQKLSISDKRVDNYVFITTYEIDREVQAYARSRYAATGGIEFVLLDCIGFIRHYLHLFHRLRMDFIEEYQRMILAEPESSVSQLVKEAFLSMRQAAEAD
ncbi:MAG: restriction endonuclease, SacI family [Caldilineaceae bacterium]|nr:restriction endonuclease, SacI family [Caldilineaceae bacterium]